MTAIDEFLAVADLMDCERNKARISKGTCLERQRWAAECQVCAENKKPHNIGRCCECDGKIGPSYKCMECGKRQSPNAWGKAIARRKTAGQKSADMRETARAIKTLKKPRPV